MGNKVGIELVGSCLKRDNLTFTHGKTVDIYIAYEISVSNHRYDYCPTLENCLFGAVNMTKNDNIYKYKCSAYGIRVDRCGSF